MVETLLSPDKIAQDPRPDVRGRLVDAALATFVEEGYRASIDRIAARAQVARQTIYNHFGSKDALFAEVIRQASRSILVTLDTGRDLRTALIDFGQAYREKVLSPDGLAIFRTIVSEAPHFPDLSQQVFQIGPLSTRNRLSTYLAQAMQSNLLRQEDPDFAAQNLIAMLVEYERIQALFTLNPVTLSPENTAQIIDRFLRLFAPEKETP